MEATRLLDLTRLVSRLGKGALTGIDRVELAYLRRFAADTPPLFGLVRTAAGWLLLNRAGCEALAGLVLQNTPLPRADLLSRLLHRRDHARARAETAARKIATARSPRPGLARLVRVLPRPAIYFNVGHANLTAPGLSALRSAGFSIRVMVHDTIPLDHPQLVRADSIAPFRQKLAAVATHADCVIHLTQASRTLTDAQMARLGRVPPGVTAPLGVAVAQPDMAALPPGLELSDPYFVTLGTIEPRKNHTLLLDVWDRLPAPKPRLFILGNRGWAAPDVLARLDRLAPDGPVQVLHGLPDSAVSALIAGARALLAPSLAEGFGLPPVEAASLDTPVLATDLAVTRELLGNKAVYLPAADIYSWVETVVRQASIAPVPLRPPAPLTLLSWDDHFNTVLSVV